MSKILPYQKDGFSIRAIEIGGEPWFVGKDVAAALGYADTVNAIKQHCKGVVKRHPLPTAGGIQDVRIINEPDLFRLVVNSALPAAERFERWVFEEVLPSIRKTGGYRAASPVRLVTEAARAFPPLFRAARLLGCDKNAAAIAANQAVMSATQVNLLQQLGHTHLEAENQEARFFTPTELGQMLGGLSGRKVNLLLAEAGMQAKRGDEWEALEAGQAFARIYDTGKKHGSGVPIQQVKWSSAVLPLLRKEDVA
ncbi:BRO-N domain-containing protein [Achromobacter insuavis]|uniref:Prophage antirepressor n=1 Tax=Achromobacter insuavis AXX-A TaxID=1003200 RepID=F7TB74_9BURK|nr:Bro-N domain-containing protein [Achromobacter insuavis]EGP42431.1 prophage antirepressor [Achromobacter insuavis AXX-A]